MQELYELKPSDNLRMLMAFSCRKQADFDRFFSTFTELERSDVTAIARALSFCSAEIADYVVGKVRQQGVDVDSNLTLQAVLSLLAAKNGALEDASRHVSAAIERLQVTSPGPMGLFVISQLVQSLCRQGHVETAMQLVEQHVGLNDENTSSHGPHRAGARQLVSDLAEALLDTKQGEYLETVAAKFNNVTVAPVTMRGDALVVQLPSIKANLAFIFHQIVQQQHQQHEGDKAVRVIFPCHRGMPALTTKTVRQTVLDVLRTYPYQNAAFRIISKHPERLSVSSTDSRLGAIPLEIKLQLPPSVVRGLQEKRKIRDKSHRKNHQ